MNQVRWAARYEQREPIVDREAILVAANTYFVSDTDDSDEEMG